MKEVSEDSLEDDEEEEEEEEEEDYDDEEDPDETKAAKAIIKADSKYFNTLIYLEKQ